MDATLEALNARAESVDAAGARALARRTEAVRALRSRCMPHGQVLELARTAPAAPVAGLGRLAARVLGVIAKAVSAGAAGAQVGAVELGRALGLERGRAYTAAWMWQQLGALERAGFIVRHADYVPAAESALGGAYVTYTAAERRRPSCPRSLRSDAPHAYAFSRVRNLYTLGAAARAMKLGARCGQVRGQLAAEVHLIATGLLPSSGSVSRFSVSGDQLCSSRSCEFVDNAPAARSEQIGCAPPIGVARGCPEAEAFDGCSRAPTHSGVLRGLVSRLRRFLGGERPR